MAQQDLKVRRNLVIPGGELVEQASRASGPGGQHVNKTSTRVTLRWSIRDSAALGARQRARLLARLAPRLTRDGELLVHSGRFRSRARNREYARERLAEVVSEALREPRRRVPTAPTGAARSRRLEAKRHRSQTKRRRGPVKGDD